MASRSCLFIFLLLLAFQSTVIKANTVAVLPPQCRPVVAGTLARFEYLVNLIIGYAEFFLRSSTGAGIEDIAPGLVQGPVPIGATVANLDNATRAAIREFGLALVGNLRAIVDETLLRAPLSRPQLNFTAGVFTGILNLSGLTPPFNVYGSTTQFLLVAEPLTSSLLQFYLAQVIPSIAGNDQQQLAAGIGLTAAAQAGYFRTRLNAIVNSPVPPYTMTVANFTNTTATAVNQLGLCGVKNEGLIVPLSLGAENRTTTNVVPGDVNSLSPRRTEREVLRIVFGTRNATRPGGIFLSFNGALFRLLVALRQS
ncbi:ferritin-like catalase Nec2 [Gossypium arboreum]|uniref:Desiccation-related protein PCC13-62-like n=1 Tax=Gossypium arboreum TaxID=29729 RepID=A0ABR0MK36_GOSAR|nr:ferritin-like catalase Nec2 [Gossypium arboreum]KAK5774376.1 hypothetical protein PVK06_042231 [Gossypium arboreum]